MIINHTKKLKIIESEACISLESDKGFDFLCFTHNKENGINSFTLQFSTITPIGDSLQSIIKTNKVGEITVGHEEPLSGLHLLILTLDTKDGFLANSFEIDSRDHENAMTILMFFQKFKELAQRFEDDFNFNYSEWVNKLNGD